MVNDIPNQKLQFLTLALIILFMVLWSIWAFRLMLNHSFLITIILQRLFWWFNHHVLIMKINLIIPIFPFTKINYFVLIIKMISIAFFKWLAVLPYIWPQNHFSITAIWISLLQWPTHIRKMCSYLYLICTVKTRMLSWCPIYILFFRQNSISLLSIWMIKLAPRIQIQFHLTLPNLINWVLIQTTTQFLSSEILISWFLQTI